MSKNSQIKYGIGDLLIKNDVDKVLKTWKMFILEKT